MKYSLFLGLCSVVLFFAQQTVVFAAEHPEGDITFYNASNKNITAEVSKSTFGKFNLTAKAQKTLSYSSLIQVCSSDPKHCKAEFYVNNVPAGSATIDATTGKLVTMNLDLKVQTAKSHQVLRNVVLQ